MEQRFEKWEKIRAKGKMNYVVVYGVVLWGLVTATLFAFAPSLLMGAKISLLRVVLSVILFPIGGIFFGYFTWTANEKAYQRAKGSEPSAAQNGGPVASGGNLESSERPPSVS